MKKNETKITPEIAKKLALESLMIRKFFKKELQKMWKITPKERFAVSK